MLIVFWSPNHGQSGTTTTTINHAVVTTLATGKKVLIGHGDFSRSTLEKCLIGKSVSKDDIYSDQGLSALTKLAKNGRLTPSMIKDYTTPILSKSRLDLMQGTDIEMDNEKDLNVLRKIFLYCNDIYDYTFVDLHSGIENDFTMKMLENADMVVVCLNQNFWINDYFFNSDEYNNVLKNKNLVFHINNYNDKSKLNVKSFKKLFNVQNVICTNNYTSIVENQNSGAIVDYILREYSNKKSDIGKQLSKNVNSIIFNNEGER